MKPHLLEDLKLKGFDPASGVLEEFSVVLTRNNFGCGSSREHAPWAFEVNGINVIIAEGFARIFRQNMLNCGMLPIELPKKEINKFMKIAKSGKATAKVNIKNLTVTLKSGAKSETASFTLDAFASKLIKAEGWVAFAEAAY
jgi:3-isopropylmalate/(R)-2-methylmalate dehydratase small subunit